MPDQPAAGEAEPFNPATDCHPTPAVNGGPPGVCPSMQPCTLRCHIRWLDGQTQPNDQLADQARATEDVTR